MMRATSSARQIIFFFLDEPQILVGKDKKHLDAMDTSDSTVKYIPYKESECGEAAGLTAGIAYPENWQEQVGVSYEIKQQRGRVLDPRKTEAKNKGLCATMLSPMFTDTIRR